MASRDVSSVNLPILTEKNWSRWSTQMRVLFRYQDMNEVVEGEVQELPTGAADKRKVEERKKDDKALFLIHQCVDDAHFEKIQHAKTAREAWSILVRCHTGGEKIKKLQTLRRQYELMQMLEGDKVREYFDKVVAITNQMKGCGEVITDLMVIEKIMRSLPQRFDYIVVAIEESKRTGKDEIRKLQSSLEAHEMRMLERYPVKIDEQALKVHHGKSDAKKKQKKWKGKKGNWKSTKSNDDQNDDSDAAEDKGNREKYQKKKDKKSVERYNCHKLGHYAKDCYANKGKQKKHQGKEAYEAQEDSDSRTYHSNEMTCNLLSIGQLVEKGFTAVMGNRDRMEIDLEVQDLQKLNIPINMDVVENLECMTVAKANESWIWHLRFGHLNFKYLKYLGEKEMKPFKSLIRMRAEDCLEVVHSDICGPFDVPSLAGNRYFITFVDEFNRMLWLHVIKMKSDALDVFIKFKANVERETGK
ncbi:hypothetical protein V8G54_023804 [Vigna mungo]|uniref:GAG-pre-integrase domain-containing protein n=1 Tax=Vigna mungo TaxID=3915 RepID=A0AAQ3N641_VIGMU